MKKLKLKPIIIAILLVVFQSICYATSRTLNSNIHLIGGIIDDKIAFNIYFMIPYMCWYFLLFIVPYYLFIKDKNSFSKYCLSFILVTLIANIVFAIYPTTVIRPQVTGNNILELLTRFIFWIDTPPLNCFPSQHCAMSMLWLLFIDTSKKSNNIVKIIITILSISIMIATLFVKQHVFIDLVSGDIIAICVFIVIKYENKLTNKFKELLKI